MSRRARVRAALRGGWLRVRAFLRSRSPKIMLLFGLPYLATVASIGSYLWHGGTGPPSTLEVGLLAGAMAILMVNALAGATT